PARAVPRGLVRGRRLRVERPARSLDRPRRHRDLPPRADREPAPLPEPLLHLRGLPPALPRRHVAHHRQHGLPLRAHGRGTLSRRPRHHHRARRAVERLRPARHLPRLPAEEPEPDGSGLSRCEARARAPRAARAVATRRAPAGRSGRGPPRPGGPGEARRRRGRGAPPPRGRRRAPERERGPPVPPRPPPRPPPRATPPAPPY